MGGGETLGCPSFAGGVRGSHWLEPHFSVASSFPSLPCLLPPSKLMCGMLRYKYKYIKLYFQALACPRPPAPLLSHLCLHLQLLFSLQLSLLSVSFSDLLSLPVLFLRPLLPPQSSPLCTFLPWLLAPPPFSFLGAGCAGILTSQAVLFGVVAFQL